MLTLRAIVSNIKKGQSALAVRYILNQLEMNYQEMKLDISLSGCKTEADSTTIFMKMPSKTTDSVLYDVVLWVDSKEKVTMDSKFKVYSNSAGFGYNFAYVFYKSGSLLFPNLYPAEFKTLSPKMRNPYMSVGFDRHVFSAIRYVSEYKLSAIIGQFSGTGVPNVKSFQQKMQEISDIREELRRSRVIASSR